MWREDLWISFFLSLCLFFFLFGRIYLFFLFFLSLTTCLSLRGVEMVLGKWPYISFFCFFLCFLPLTTSLSLRGIGEVAVYQRTTRPSLRTFPCHLQHPVAITTTLSSVCLPNKSCKKQKNGIHTLAERKVILTSTNCSRKVCEIESGSWQR